MKKSVLFTKRSGKWYMTVQLSQCRGKVWPRGQCQGERGHKGWHWCYREDGTLCQAINRAEKKPSRLDSVASQTPPGHRNYVSPEKMADKCFRHMFTRSLVTDQKTIARLEDGRIRLHESICRPVEEKKKS
jgi:hypothetical protein